MNNVSDIDSSRQSGSTTTNTPTGLKAVPAEQRRAPLSASNWQSHLVRTEAGPLVSCLANAVITLEYHPEWQGVLAFDENAGEVNARFIPPCDDWDDQRELPFAWKDNDDARTAVWLQRDGLAVGKELASQAVQVVANKHAFHPIQDYLNSLMWDEEERLNYWLTACLGVENETAYVEAVAAKYLVSAAARVLNPGAKVDTCLILEGKQGKLKSTALRTLVVHDKWFTDEIPDIRGKDAAIQLRGKWLVELGELDAIQGPAMSRVKAFLSRSVDRYRPVNGKYAIDVLRQNVFAGSVNHSQYLRDETGGRRFWPIEAGHIDIPLLKEWREQLWAEAVVRYRSGFKWWMESEDLVSLASAEQHSRYEPDSWESKIASFTLPKMEVTTAEILGNAACLGKLISEWTQKDQNRVARCLTSLGFEKIRGRMGEKRENKYRRQHSG